MKTADVTIVGAGPVGLVLALLVGHRGVSVDVIERRADPYGRPRAVHLDHQAARILQAAGVMDELAPLTEPMDAYEWRNGAGDVLLRLEGGLGVSGWPASLMFSQPDLERLLEAAVRRHDRIRLRRGLEVTGLAPHAGGVEVTAVGAGGETTVAISPWVVGCEGAAGVTAAAIGAPLDGAGYSSPWLIVDVRPAEPRVWRPLNVQLCDPARPTTAVSGGPGRRRFEFMRIPGDAPGDAERSDAERPDAVWRLLEPWGLTPANATIERYATYTFRAAAAGRWRRGRIVIAGDAAHQMPPFAGQGLCSGLRDAANLAWKLDLVMAGKAPDDLIDTYHSERAPQVRAEIDFSVDLGRIICILDPGAAAERDEGMVAAASASGPVEIPPGPPLRPGVTRAGDPGAGALGVQAVVASQGRRGRFDDVVGAGWLLLHPAGDRPVLPGSLAAWWASIGGRTVGVAGGSGAGGSGVVDVEGTYGRWLAELDAAVVLQRPDFHLFGTAATVGGAADLVAALRATLSE